MMGEKFMREELALWVSLSLVTWVLIFKFIPL